MFVFHYGIQVPDVDIVVHWGPIMSSFSTDRRLGGVGAMQEAILYTPPYSINKSKLSKDMLSYLELQKDECLRKYIFTDLKLDNKMT